jgi:hypothetical protein
MGLVLGKKGFRRHYEAARQQANAEIEPYFRSSSRQVVDPTLIF